MKIHEKYIKRCIDLAKNGLGSTYPNPLVGCVIVHQGRIIGEGWHQKAGGPHAEVVAIASVKDKSLMNRSTLYVSLEPCSHFGKTPPCSNLILEHEIPKVVIGSIDPYNKVSGKGVEKLRKSNCEVVVGVLEEECIELNKRFFTYHTNKRPYIILKWAETNDGFMDVERKIDDLEKAKSNWITNQYSRQLVHKWRTEEQAILVGTNTVINDNPKLNVRSWCGHNPIRIVLDKNLRIPNNYNILDGSTKTIILTEKEGNRRANIFFEMIGFNEKLAEEVCSILYKNEIQSVIIEGGTQTLETFIKENLWDEARIFKSEVIFSNGVKAPSINGKIDITKTLLSDDLKVIKNC